MSHKKSAAQIRINALLNLNPTFNQREPMKKFKTIEVNDYEEMLREISTSIEIDLDNYSLLIFGSGQNKKFFSELKSNPNYEVLWSGWFGPKWTRIFSFIPGQAGLVRVLKQEAFYELYHEMAAYSVSDVIYIEKAFMEELVNQVKTNAWRVNFESFTKKDTRAFVLTSEANDSITKNGKEMFYYNYEFGFDLNQLIKDIITRKT